MTYTELIQFFKQSGFKFVETDHEIMRDFQATISIYERYLTDCIQRRDDPKKNLELKKRKAQMMRWFQNWDKYTKL